MINTYTVSKAIRDQIADYQTVKNLDPLFIHGELVGSDPGRTPMVAVYRSKLTQAPHTLGHNTWKAQLTNDVLLMHASFESGEKCMELLDNLVNVVNSAILSDLTFSGAVLHTSAVDTVFGYVESSEMTDAYYQTAVITISSEARSNV